MAKKKPDTEVRSQEWLDTHNTAEEAMSTIIITDAAGEITFMGKNVVIPPEAEEDLGTATGDK